MPRRPVDQQQAITVERRNPDQIQAEAETNDLLRRLGMLP